MNNRYREEENEINENVNSDDLDNMRSASEEVLEESDSLDDGDNEKESNKKNKKVKKLHLEIEKLKEENKALNDKYMRVLADSENYRKRIDDERIRERKYGSQRLLEKLVNSLDIFDKAVNMKTDDPNLNNFLIGFQMINNNLKSVLEEEGVKKIKSFGKFDPHFHHAIETDYDESKEEDEIISVIKDGYMYKDRVLSPALVKVNKKPTEEVNDNTNSEENN